MAPTINIAQPTPEHIKEFPREFALLVQLQGNSMPYSQFAKEYGTEAAASLEGNVSFEHFAKAFAKQPEEWEGKGDTYGYAARDKSGHLAPFRFQRRALLPKDVRMQITHCGICHSDLHEIKDEWGKHRFPIVPGHEVVGIVTEVGPEVTKFKVGDRAGIGCMVNSCRTCDYCKQHEENYCSGGLILTYNSVDHDGSITYGGYSDHIVCTEDFVLHMPANLPLNAAAPLLCAGITTYSPLRYFGLDKPGMHIGVVGLGGLGHMAVQLAKAMGTKVTVISTSDKKKEEALKQFKADGFLISKDAEAMTAAASTFDGIIDTVSAKHPLTDYLNLLKTNGKMVLVGAPSDPHSFGAFNLIPTRKTIAGSMIGGIKETQEMLDFCGKHNITPMIEDIKFDYVNKAFERLEANDVKYRFVIDVQGSLIGPKL